MDNTEVFRKDGKLTVLSILLQAYPAIATSEETEEEELPQLTKFLLDNVGQDAIVLVLLNPYDMCTCDHRRHEHQWVDAYELGACTQYEWQGCNCHGYKERCGCDEFKKKEEK